MSGISKIGEFTTLYDSFGTPIHEGDTVEYFDWCYANEGRYTESFSKDKAIKSGYNCEHKFNFYDKEQGFVERVEFYKPCVGIVKWNSKYVTYEPIVDYQDYNNNSFHYVISSSSKKDESYCKVIKKYNE